jgi:hypothetical protein
MFQTVQIPPCLVNEHYDDRYFDVVNAIDEAKHIFFRAAALWISSQPRGLPGKNSELGKQASAQAAY